jgi:hypothetical protein
MSTNRSQFGQIVLETLSQKYLTQNRPGRVARVIATLPSKHEALSSFKPQNHQKKKKKKEGSLNWSKGAKRKKKLMGLDMVISACNSSYSGGRDRRFVVSDHHRLLLDRLYFKNQSTMVSHISGPRYLGGESRKMFEA